MARSCVTSGLSPTLSVEVTVTSESDCDDSGIL
eukprot:CAMPEP_0194507378 /NCGR_PEP_ID=MMETSP0253-20130528/36868_1 /TAXON_ID=2966 /ORGANISM="Noctiluca scintillans" /LENGTH=32 /DNA_ID= /DNA_START= /DNA_END= /DNA_ORIENTATION=